MYPISFDNPNRRGVSGRQGAEDGKTLPQAHNDTAPTTNDAESNSLLVVEWRCDDTWHVELCTDLTELGGAMDMARGLHGSPGVDEVCLTLEMSGAQGRESRREVLRFLPDTQHVGETQKFSAGQSPLYSSRHVPDHGGDHSKETVVAQNPSDSDHAMAVLNAALKTPDYDMETLDFSEFAMPNLPQADTSVAALTTPEEDDGAEIADELDNFKEPIDNAGLSDVSWSTEEADRDGARQLLSSIYGADNEPSEDDNLIRVNMPTRQHQHPADQVYEALSDSARSKGRSTPGGHGWLESDEAFGIGSDLKFGLEPDTGPDLGADGDNSDRLERLVQPFVAQRSETAAKLLVVAGTIALLILGGALAELLAVDITTTANAGVGAFDTFSTVSGSPSHY